MDRGSVRFSLRSYGPNLDTLAVGTIVDGDMAVERRGSGLERRGCGVCSRTVCRLGRVCHHLRAAGGKVVVVVVNDVGCADGDCADIVSDDVAVLARQGMLVMRAVGAGGSPQACEAMSQVLGHPCIIQ
jgi:hypothetical protein